jgi:hypothetical protein
LPPELKNDPGDDGLMTNMPVTEVNAGKFKDLPTLESTDTTAFQKFIHALENKTLAQNSYIFAFGSNYQSLCVVIRSMRNYTFGEMYAKYFNICSRLTGNLKASVVGAIGTAIFDNWKVRQLAAPTDLLIHNPRMVMTYIRSQCRPHTDFAASGLISKFQNYSIDNSKDPNYNYNQLQSLLVEVQNAGIMLDSKQINSVFLNAIARVPSYSDIMNMFIIGAYSKTGYNLQDIYDAYRNKYESIQAKRMIKKSNGNGSYAPAYATRPQRSKNKKNHNSNNNNSNRNNYPNNKYQRNFRKNDRGHWVLSANEHIDFSDDEIIDLPEENSDSDDDVCYMMNSDSEDSNNNSDLDSDNDYEHQKAMLANGDGNGKETSDTAIYIKATADSGSTRHLWTNRKSLLDIRTLPSKKFIYGISGSNLAYTEIGNVILNDNIEIGNVAYVPGAKQNLISIPKLCDAGCTVIFTPTGGYCLRPGNRLAIPNDYILKFIRESNGLFTISKSTGKYYSDPVFKPKSKEERRREKEAQQGTTTSSSSSQQMRKELEERRRIPKKKPVIPPKASSSTSSTSSTPASVSFAAAESSDSEIDYAFMMNENEIKEEKLFNTALQLHVKLGHPNFKVLYEANKQFDLKLSKDQLNFLKQLQCEVCDKAHGKRSNIDKGNFGNIVEPLQRVLLILWVQLVLLLMIKNEEFNPLAVHNMLPLSLIHLQNLVFQYLFNQNQKFLIKL